MSEVGFHFSRTDYARKLVDALTGDELADYSSGLFLAAPRRTGKSTFLRRDLIPELERKEIICIYVDLWEDKTRDPAELIAEAIRKKILELTDRSLIEKMRSTGLTKLQIPGFVSVDLDSIGRPGGSTLNDALSYIHKKHGNRIALIVDEAQQTLVSEKGTAAMFSLKAARDEFNQNAKPGHPSLLLVFTGSNRDKLTSLVIERKQPFFGARVLKFPLLDRAFTDALTIWMNKKLNPDRQFEPDDVAEAFEILGSRPEFIREAATTAAFETDSATHLGEALKALARKLRDRSFDDLTLKIDELTELQRSILERLVETGAENFTPFTADSLAEYAKKTGKKVTASQVQAAIERLRKLEMLWNPERGVYAIEDTDIEMAIREGMKSAP